MIKYRDIAFVAYVVNNMAKARKFYEGVLGLKLARKFSKDFVEYDIGRGTIALGHAPKFIKPSRNGSSATRVAGSSAAVSGWRRARSGWRSSAARPGGRRPSGCRSS